MKTRPVVPARIDWSDAAAPVAPDFGDLYHPREGALAQARHVFLSGNRLPERWHGRDAFALLETGFGLGHNFLAVWDAWRGDAQRCARLSFVSIEKHPPSAQDLARAHAASALPELSRELLARWPALTPNLHRLAFDAGRVELLLLFADVADAMREIVGRFDAFLLDGFAPAKNPAMWQPRVFAALGRLAAPGATAATWSVAREVRDGLASAGFAVERAPGFGAKREMTVATFAPRHIAVLPPGRQAPLGSARDVVVVGAGLAGSAAAAALAGRGFDVSVVDRCDAAALAAAGPRGGLFHGTVHADDGAHARLIRASALCAESELRDATTGHGVNGSTNGLLRLHSTHPDLERMRATLAAQALPPRYVQALDAADAAALAGVAIGAPAWHYPGGGWIDPGALCARWLAADGVRLRAGGVAALRRDGERWQLLDIEGRVVAAASTVVLAGGAAGLALLGALASQLALVRGQTSRWRAGTPGLRAPRVPIADAGYALALADGSVLCGASSDLGDAHAAPRAADHRANLLRLERLTGSRIAPADDRLDADRVGWRLVAADRLPLIGALPANAPAARRLDQPRFVPRAPNLFVFSALGSRGITLAPLGARLLAAQIAGTPWPLEASLANAVDPARFVARAVRRAAS